MASLAHLFIIDTTVNGVQSTCAHNLHDAYINIRKDM